MESSSYISATHAKRFVVEDSITKVTSDGEPHEMMTMIAGLAGLLAAIAILAVLISLVACKKPNGASECKRCSNESIDKTASSKRSSLSTVYTRTDSLPESQPAADRVCRLISISTISSNNSDVVLQRVCTTNRLSLHGDGDSYGDMAKKKKRAHWSDDLEQGPQIAIDVERF